MKLHIRGNNAAAKQEDHSLEK